MVPGQCGDGGGVRVDIGVDTCKALGLDPDHVSFIEIDLRPGNITEITVGLLVDADGAFVEHLADYRLTWAPPTGPPIPDPFGFLEG